MKVVSRKRKCDIKKKGNKKLYHLIVLSLFMEKKKQFSLLQKNKEDSQAMPAIISKKINKITSDISYNISIL